MTTLKTNIREHIREAIFEVTKDGNFEMENLQTLIKELAGGIGFVFGAMQIAAGKTLPPDLINESVDEIANYIKEVVVNVGKFEPPTAN
jgi:hypothetical protein